MVAEVEVSGLSKRYRAASGAADAVDGLDLAVYPGEVFGLLGPNGAGKTTLIKILMGLSAASEGRVSVFGLDPAEDARAIRAQTGYVTQGSAADVHLTGRKNLSLFAALYGLPRRGRGQRIGEVLRWAGLEEAADRTAQTYSGGMMRRLDLAIGLLHRPRLLVLDDPTLGLDVQTRRQVWDLILALKSRGETVLLTTHYLEEADHLCDRVAIMQSGRFVGLDTPSGLRRDLLGDAHRLTISFDETPDITVPEAGVRREVRGNDLILHGPPERLWAAFNRILNQSAPPVQEIGYDQPTLDDVFLKLTQSETRERAS